MKHELQITLEFDDEKVSDIVLLSALRKSLNYHKRCPEGHKSECGYFTLDDKPFTITLEDKIR